MTQNIRPSTAVTDTRAFRDALGSFATGVTVVTTCGSSGEDIGITANSFNSVSLEPPMVLWSISKKSKSLAAFSGNSYFAVHVLAADQDGISKRFATRGAAKFDGLALERGIGGLPLLPNCSARFQCRRAFEHEGGDHVILVGEVVAFEHFDRPPLLFHGGRYLNAVAKAELPIDGADAREPESSFSRDFLVSLLGRAHFQLFHGLRRDLERHGLSESEWLVLSVLGVSTRHSIDELDRQLWYTGRRVSYELVARLASAGFLNVEGTHDPQALVTLTEAGRQIVIELIAAAKAIEAHAERNLGFGETQALKTTLRAVIRDAPSSPPPILPPVAPE